MDDLWAMKGLERITNIRLAEVLTQKGQVTREEMADVIASQEATGEPFANVLISTGYLTEWDLARLVSEYFQMPFLLTDRYNTPQDTIELLTEDFMFEHMVLPMDKFGDILTLAIPVFLAGDIIQKIQDEKNLNVFPVVSLYSENKRRLVELFPEHKIVEKKKPVATAAKDGGGGEGKGKGKGGGDWESIFDIGDEAVKQDLQ